MSQMHPEKPNENEKADVKINRKQESYEVNRAMAKVFNRPRKTARTEEQKLL